MHFTKERISWAPRCMKCTPQLYVSKPPHNSPHSTQKWSNHRTTLCFAPHNKVLVHCTWPTSSGKSALFISDCRRKNVHQSHYSIQVPKTSRHQVIKTSTNQDTSGHQFTRTFRQTNLVFFRHLESGNSQPKCLHQDIKTPRHLDIRTSKR